MVTQSLPGIADLVGEIESTIIQVRSSLVQIWNSHAGAGAGIIWSKDGVILTNDHVLGDAHRPPRVILADGAEFAAEILAREPEFDLALIKIAGKDLPAAQIGDSRSLQVGQLVFAVGHPWGQTGYVTSGILSALASAMTRQGRKIPVIRTDLALAPGNSGGPLVNALGEVIGINTLIIGGDQGVAVPVHLAQDLVERISKHGNGNGSAGHEEAVI